MDKGNKGKFKNGFTPKELEIFLRARRDRKTVSFERGFPSIVEIPRTQQKCNRNDKPHKSVMAQIGADENDLPDGSILGPIEDLLAMVYSLEMYASHYSEGLSMIERRREDCTHELEPRRDGNFSMKLTDEQILAIGKKLQRISEERRTIKNRFEVIKLIKRAFETGQGMDSLAFLLSVVKDVAHIQAEQKQRVYTPRTNELDDLDQMISAQSAPAFVGPDIPSQQYDGLTDDPPGVYDEPPEIPDEVFELAKVSPVRKGGFSGEGRSEQ